MSFMDWYNEQYRATRAQIELFASGRIGMHDGPSPDADDITTDVLSRLRGWLVELDTLREKYGSAGTSEATTSEAPGLRRLH
jgi:hypothetical protein